MCVEALVLSILMLLDIAAVGKYNLNTIYKDIIFPGRHEMKMYGFYYASRFNPLRSRVSKFWTNDIKFSEHARNALK